MADGCILCGKCLAVCPLAAATDREELGPRAKANLCAQLAAGDGALQSADVAKLAGMCLGCRRCVEACSRGVDVPGLVAALRGAHPDFKAWLWKTWLTHAESLWSASSATAKLIPERFAPERFGPFLKILAGLKGGPGLEPILTPRSFPDTHRGEKTLLFAGCTANYVQGRWLMASLRLLDGLGVEVLSGEFGCCGGGLKAAGFEDEAAAMAERNIGVWRKAGRPKVVTFCASCRSGLAAYGDRFERESEGDEWRNSLTPLSSILQDIGFVVSCKASKRIGYHRSCHASDPDPDLAFLARVLGDRLAETTQRECCGFGGVMRLADATPADAVASRCWTALGSVDFVLTGCSACVAQLGATKPRERATGHWLEIIK